MSLEVELLPTEAAEDGALVAQLTALINAAYGASEEQLWNANHERIGRERVAQVVRAGEMGVAKLEGRILGSIRVRAVEAEVGYFGLLAVDPACQRLGTGGALIRFAERVSREGGARWMELRLLVPRESTDPGKYRLHAWYSRLGYEEADRGDFGASHPDSVAEMRAPLDIVTMRKLLG